MNVAKGEHKSFVSDFVREMRHGQLYGNEGMNAVQVPIHQRFESLELAALDGLDQGQVVHLVWLFFGHKHGGFHCMYRAYLPKCYK